MDILKAGFRNPWHTALFYLGIVVFVLLALFPIYYVFKMSIVSRDDRLLRRR
jgi:ABC-type glycerol-3-phosphate transport system permease component